LANAIAYVQAAIDAGLKVDEFAPQLSFFFNAHNNFLEEIAKFRAARRLYAHIMKDRFHAVDENSQKLRFHTQTAGSTLTAQQPENNVIRVTMQALSAILGGTQSLHTNSMDEALWLPTQKAVQIALRTQQIIAYESGVADVVDPLAGSYTIEYLTDEIERIASEYIKTIDGMGGALKAIENGYMQNEIQEAAFNFQRSMEEGEEIIVGVNKYSADEEITLESLNIDPAIGENQRKKLSELRTTRDNQKVHELLSRIDSAAHGTENLMPLFVECIEAGGTLGEICGLLRGIWGEYRAPTFL
ncbi:MAG: methylmalonyl-CoA mutase family protein, partial [Anaerolineaceae bacterium]|nr:methylmalonyl-CoA mutase family protein [Anaerolineaceae bacterium]